MLNSTAGRRLKYKVYYNYGRNQAKFLTKKIAKAFMYHVGGILINMDDDRDHRRKYGEAQIFNDPFYDPEYTPEPVLDMVEPVVTNKIYPN